MSEQSGITETGVSFGDLVGHQNEMADELQDLERLVACMAGPKDIDDLLRDPEFCFALGKIAGMRQCLQALTAMVITHAADQDGELDRLLPPPGTTDTDGSVPHTSG